MMCRAQQLEHVALELGEGRAVDRDQDGALQVAIERAIGEGLYRKVTCGAP